MWNPPPPNVGRARLSQTGREAISKGGIKQPMGGHWFPFSFWPVNRHEKDKSDKARGHSKGKFRQTGEGGGQRFRGEGAATGGLGWLCGSEAVTARRGGVLNFVFVVLKKHVHTAPCRLLFKVRPPPGSECVGEQSDSFTHLPMARIGVYVGAGDECKHWAENIGCVRLQVFTTFLEHFCSIE